MNTTNVGEEHDSPNHLAELMSREKPEVVLEAGSLILIILVALCGNLSVFYVIYKSPRLRNIFGIYMFSLALSDLLMTTMIMPISLAVLVTSKKSFNNLVCSFQGFFILVLAWSSLHIMALMALNRYFRVVKRSLYLRFFTKRSSLLMIFVVFLMASVFVLLPSLTGLAKFQFWPGRASCFMTLNTTYPSIRRAFISFYLAMYTILPMIIIGFCYYKVHKIVSSHRSTVFPSHVGIGPHSSAISIEEIRITKSVFAVVFAFILCWIPSLIVEMLNSVYGSMSLPRWSYILYIYLAYVSCAINPVVYGVTNRRFRKILKKSFGCFGGQEESVTMSQLTINERKDRVTIKKNIEPQTICVRTFQKQQTTN